MQNLHTGLQQQMRAALRPAHLLFLHKALADHVVHGGFHHIETTVTITRQCPDIFTADNSLA